MRSAYTLQDMTLDSLGVLDALGIAKAHIVGASMGGMIAQRLAASAPQRATSLVSIMSSSGARGLPGPRREVTSMLMRRPSGSSEAELVAHSIELLRLIQSPAYPQSDEDLAERLTFSMRRSYHPAGLMRQMLAIGADADRPRCCRASSRPRWCCTARPMRSYPSPAARTSPTHSGLEIRPRSRHGP